MNRLFAKIFGKNAEVVKYLTVGGFNTAFSYALYALLWWAFDWRYLAVVLQNIISINVSVLTMRTFVFGSRGDFWAEWRRGWGVYIGMMIANLIWQWIFDLFGINALMSQALWLVLSTAATFFLHKYFSFRKRDI